MVASRRSFLKTAALGVVAGVGTDVLLARTATAASAHPTTSATSAIAHPRPGVMSGQRSPNGWLVNSGSNAGGGIWTRPVAGAGFGVDVAIGDAEVILVHVIRRFHYEVDTLRAGDVLGFKAPTGLRGYELNHASGTAIDIRPGCYPPGSRGGFFPNQVDVIRDILAECDGAVRWGGDFTTPDEAHFQIDVQPGDASLSTIADRLRDWNATPGEGAGVIRDVTDRRRRSAAGELERRQRR